MKKSLIGFLKKQVYLRKVIENFLEWQYSSFLLPRLIGRFVSFFIYCLEPHIYSKLLQKAFVNRAIACAQSTSEDEYLRILNKLHMNYEEQMSWALRLISGGRLDLGRVGYFELLNRPSNQLPNEERLGVLRGIAIVYFMLGQYIEAYHYFSLAGQLRSTLLTPDSPRGYRILGGGWFCAIGHICVLDYYLKYLKLYAEKEVRIVAPCNIDQIQWRDLLSKFVLLGITVIKHEDVEKDYDEWARKQGFRKWSKLSTAEKVGLVDEFWEYDFYDGNFLSFEQAFARIQREWEQAKRQPLFTVSELERQWLTNYLVSLGLPRDSWYVCLHVREAGFHKAWNSTYPSMRDADISDYSLAIDEIVNAGGWVIRMGDSSMKPLPSMRNVVDYAHSPFKTTLADILLPATCRFLLGTNSGYANICIMYNTPCAFTNWVPIGAPMWSSQDLMIPKLFRDKESNEYLTLAQIFERGLAFLQLSNWLPSNVEIVDNTPRDIAQLTLEMLTYINHKDEQDHISFGAPASVQDYYKTLAKNYGGYTGSRLARSFAEKYVEIFSDPEEQSKILEGVGS